MHVEPNILAVPFHESRPLLRSMVVSQLHGTRRGRAFKVVLGCSSPWSYANDE